MHSQVYLTIACLAVALAAGATYALVTDGGRVKVSTAAVIEATKAVVPNPPASNKPLEAKTPQPELPVVAEQLRRELAASLGASVDEVTVNNLERRTWPDLCLGLPQANEMCGQSMVEGYRVVLSSGFGRYTYRTSLDGSLVRVE